MANINNDILMKAKEWDRMNPVMDPIEMPYNCRVVYRYQQPIIHSGPKNLPGDSSFLSFDGWGIVTVQSSYIMTPLEKGERQEALKKEGAVIVGNMRLTSQTFSRDKNAVSLDELGDMFGDE